MSSSRDLDFAIVVVPERGAGQDRAAVFERDDGLTIVLADGAGGASNGARAAQAVVDAVARGDGPSVDLLEQLDGELASVGLTTAVIVRIDVDRIAGASVGDSGAWIVTEHEVIDVTEHQQRKPLVGGGCAPVAFVARPLGAGATLVVASDGLFRYAARGDIARIVRGAGELAAAARELVELVRLPSGALQDDVTRCVENLGNSRRERSE